MVLENMQLFFFQTPLSIPLGFLDSGEADVTSAASEAGQVFVSAQPVLGSLFKSQNASSWDASQYEDLKFDLYRADFVETGSVQFFNLDFPADYQISEIILLMLILNRLELVLEPLSMIRI